MAIAGFLGLMQTPVQAQLSPSLYDYPHNHLPWYTIESEHYLIHFQKGNSRSAKVASRIAEEVYPGITELYMLEPDTKISITLNDRQDYSNGAAYFFDNQIQIWVPALNTPLRGTNNWLRDVISHELTHIIQLQASMKKSRRLPAVYFQWLSYEDVRRPDVLYGYPRGIITHPFASISIPAWLAEGSAQYQRSGWYYDTWDTHRDMVLRSAILNDNYLSLEEMGIFSSKNSLQREQVYNQGFSFTIYLVQQYGEEILPKISDAFSRSGVYSADEALKVATGKSGNEIFDEWVNNRKSFYTNATEDISPSETKTIEGDGFMNFFPRFSPSNNRIAYLSNKGRDESRTSLYITDTENKSRSPGLSISLGELKTSKPLSCGFGNDPLIEKIHSSFSFSPDGEKIAFIRRELNAYGEQYDDLFTYNFETGKQQRVTKSARLSSPVWHPTDNKVVAIVQSQGTQNIVLVDTTNGEVTQLTDYDRGQQLFTPAWNQDGSMIYFAFSDAKGREIRRLHIKSKEIETVIADPYADVRDPFIDSEGEFLYYASDRTGIFNIYRMPLQGGEPQQLTNVIGGAFMPNVSSDNQVVFAEYTGQGYRISSINLNEATDRTLKGGYNPVYNENGFLAYSGMENSGKSFDDSDLVGFNESFYRRADTSSVSFNIASSTETGTRQFYEYRETFTSLSFYPVIRFDNYTKLNGSNGSLIRSGQFGDLGENLLRDLKLGTYISSREVIDKLSIFGGALFGFGSRSADGIGDFFSPSRLSDLDRDLFLITEYQGLPFIKKRWSPTISLELYNLRRNVDNGLSIEEFPCTSCLPDTLNADIAYNIWEADLFLRSKIDESNLVELGVGYTSYKVQTDGFFSRELKQFIPSSSTEYFKGTFISASHVLEMFRPYKHSDIAPIGFRSFLKYTYERGKLLDDYEIRDGSLTPIYNTENNHSVELSTRLGFSFSDQTTGQINSRFFSYLNKPDDSFYLDYIGGFTGMRSYPFFALGGSTTAFGQFSYIFPLLTDIKQQAGRYTLDKIFIRVFAEGGSTWDSPLHSDQSLKTGIGSEIRFAFNSYYLFPLKLFISTAYGFNKFDVTLPDEFITETPTGKVSYGRELLLHFGLTFDFNVLNNE
ncbi:hypothetical protein G3570_04520 [Balneolaceae bacterium YR4-1]|uniref:Biopolymer transporter Tol n=2 Tax=Halalkalibaculum roseum TaxID=2709311 RepID=A0A6M1T1F0_9BACT|nr:hypothetical protein [Halalkalibaculum roseum]